MSPTRLGRGGKQCFLFWCQFSDIQCTEHRYRGPDMRCNLPTTPLLAPHPQMRERTLGRRGASCLNNNMYLYVYYTYRYIYILTNEVCCGRQRTIVCKSKNTSFICKGRYAADLTRNIRANYRPRCVGHHLIHVRMPHSLIAGSSETQLWLHTVVSFRPRAVIGHEIRPRKNMFP